MTWRNAAFNHARQTLPHECCGLLIGINGMLRYWPCKNESQELDTFIIAAEDWAAAEDTGDIIAVIHSHVSPPLKASEQDLISCKRSQLPWHIIDATTGEWCLCLP